MLIVKASPKGDQFTEFLRIDIIAEDDGTTQPPVVPPFEILFTTDGSIPSDSNPSTKLRRSPIKQLPIDGPVTIKFFARSLTPPVVTTPIFVEFYDVLELTARNEVPTVGPNIRNYTLKIDDIGDFVRTSPGQLEVVFGVDKTRQDIRESILVENVPQNASTRDRTLPQFGSALNRILGQDFPIGFATSEIQASLFSALTTLIGLQREERVPADEQIRRIVSLNVVPLDPTSFRYHFVVETTGGLRVGDSGTIVS